MHRHYLVIALIVSLTVVIAGCRTAPLYNVDSATIVSRADGNTYSLEEVGSAVQRAGVTLGWTMDPVEPGHIVGTLHLRSHMAQVDVRYSNMSYSITYKDSDNLNYDGTIIHKNYNGWIQNLDKGIQTQLSLI